jgi:3-oxoacyl-[acyl-carrier-protein] reductase (EC 1.1.1.100)
MGNLTGQVALVTGASRGIGRAIALELAKSGANLILNYAKNCPEDLITEIKQLGQEAIAVQADVSQEEQVEHLVKTGLAQWGRIDVLVNNAGITRDALLLRMKTQDWQR